MVIKEGGVLVMLKLLKDLLNTQSAITDGNIKMVLLEIPQIIKEKEDSDEHTELLDLKKIYLKACIYLGHYTRPYHTLKKLDDLTSELNGEMYIEKYFSLAGEAYYTVHILGRVQQFYGKALTELLQAMNTHDRQKKIEVGCRYFEESMALLSQLKGRFLKNKEHFIVDIYFTFLTLLAVLKRKEEFDYFYKHIFSWQIDFSDKACQMLFYEMEIMMLTLGKEFEAALAVYRCFFESETNSYIPTLGAFIISCFEKTGNDQEYERFLKKSYLLELEKFGEMKEYVLDSLLRNRKNLTLDIYIDSFRQDFNIIGGKPAVYKFN